MTTEAERIMSINTNTNVVLSENQNFGSSLGTPTGIFTPRLLRLSTNLKF